MNTKLLLCLFLVAGLVSATTAQADITFGAATTMSSDTDVSINGNLEYAYAFAPPSTSMTVLTVVHTVPFRNGQDGLVNPAANAANFAQQDLVTTTGLDQINNTVFNGDDTPPAGSTNASLSAEYQTLVAGAAFGPAGTTTGDITLGSLTVGDEYEVQLWLHDARNVSSGRMATVTSGANSVTLAFNSSDAIPGGAEGNNNGGVGQFVIGTFTAIAGTETFTLSVPTGQGGLQLNAIQVRNISVPVLLGDVNLDGAVNFFDIAPFIELLATGRYQVEADINMCGVVDFFQVEPFIRLLRSSR